MREKEYFEEWELKTDSRWSDDGEILVLPLMMFGKIGNKWHEPGKSVRKRIKTGETTYKTGAKKGQVKPVYEWVADLKKKKVVTGYKEITRGKNKGQMKPIYETILSDYESTGFYPSANAIYMNTFGGSRRLTPAAEGKLLEWKNLAARWAEKNNWEQGKIGEKVVIEMTFYLPDDGKTRDTHNAKKLLLDALEGVIHENDMWMIDRTIDFHFVKENPRIELEISRAWWE
ncbi:endodeoxyribonuclease [Bacillus phage 049ML001]|uniref:Endodeoxyribonuclease n=1 Tax=Bacillus phage 049ML001 TaxID=2601660 RepID=A0A5P8PI98_9CAUD|nr:endodeoxyribonuclease [Bacillus phage 049ML001]QFR56365.1 endodeoxyribonuclease [Bacillus phage 049ML001]QFR56447.1 endodeoxyribonuclease [Bacillus phage 049ML003]